MQNLGFFDGIHALDLVSALFMSIVNPARAAFGLCCKIDIVFVSKTIGWSGSSKNDNGFYIQSVGYVHEKTIRANKKIGLGKKGCGFPHCVLTGKAGNILEYRFFMISELDNGKLRRDGIDKLNPMIKWPIFDSFLTARTNGNDRLWEFLRELLRPLSFLFG
jgi:hypothetical protein